LTFKTLKSGIEDGGKLSRRTVFKGLLGSVAAIALPTTLRAKEKEPILHISSDAVAHIPSDFLGLSYESSQLSHPQFFSADNHALIQYFRTLNGKGVLRLGGNMSEYTRWEPDARLENTSGETEGPDPGFGTDRVFPVTPQSIDNLNGFLQATGWKLIYGLNLARGETASAVAEAKYVVATIGDRLLALQFGNEPDLFKHNGDSSRKWTYEEFIVRWKQFYAAVRAQLPHVPIAGPDTSNPLWIARFADDVGRDVVLQTSHFYAEGPPTDPRMTIDYLLSPGERLQTSVLQAIALSKKSGVPYRMAEGNTCYAAGKAGVSDTFASALWVTDFMLTVAQAGATGVNLHGGGNGLYTPIAGSSREGYTARPIYYGMLMARPLLGSTLLHAEMNAGERNVAAYAARNQNTLQIVVVNREHAPFACRLVAPAFALETHANIWRLEAPAVSSKTGVTLAHATVASNGLFQAKANEPLRFQNQEAVLQLAPYSAALVSVSLEKAHA
jgi:hypothetical protein